MDILNFISWIKGNRVVTSVNASQTLIPVGLKDGRRDDDYLAVGITAQDFITQVAGVIPQGVQGPIGPQGVAGPVGPAGLNWQGAWSAGGVYLVNDAVGYAGASYFCINPVGPSPTDPATDTINWALLASQGSPGSQGIQGVQGPQGPQGPAGAGGAGGAGGLPIGTSQYQTLFYVGAQWQASSGLTNNGGRIGINTVNTVGQALRIIQNTPQQPVAGYRAQSLVANSSVSNVLVTPVVTFSYGVNPPSLGNPIMDNSIFFNTGSNAVMKFSCGNFAPNEKLMIFPNNQVVVGNTIPLNTTDANLVVTNAGIELEEFGAGIYMRSPNGTRWLVQVSNGGALTVTLA